MTEIAEIQAYGPGKRSVGPEEFSLSSWCGGPSSSPRESEPDGIPQKASQFPSPPPIGNESAATGGLDCEPQSEEGHSSFGESMDEYDNDPVPVEELLREKDLHDSHAQGFVLDQEHTMWTKRDLVIASSGLYKPWFFSRFAKGWIGISRQNALSDIRSIMGSGRDRNKEIAAREREQRERESECQRGARSKRILTQDESCGEGSEEESETWVGCDECGKWRKVPDGVEIDAEKNFFCRMLPGCMCSTPEEDWSVPVRTLLNCVLS